MTSKTELTASNPKKNRIANFQQGNDGVTILPRIRPGHVLTAIESGVNTSPNYATLMGFGEVAEDGELVVTDSLLQGGIVCGGEIQSMLLEA
jgi:hypothetical protein